ncbi:putative chitinase 3, partial [Orchesella cincta]
MNFGVFFACLSVVAADRGPVDWYDCKGKPDANYVHPYDCTKFMTCVAQFYAYERDCVVGLHYDPANDRCEWPEIVGCITDPPTTTAAPTTTTPSTTTSATTTTQTTPFNNHHSTTSFSQ